jgi:hypothetical protein
MYYSEDGVFGNYDISLLVSSGLNADWSVILTQIGLS